MTLAAHQPDSDRHGDAGAPPQPRRILFVDDEPNVLESLRDQLRPWRRTWRMSFVDSAREALAELERERYDVIVSDMRMPVMDGAQLLARVSAEHPDTVRIVLSGHADADALAAASRVAHLLLRKPCQHDVLVSALAGGPEPPVIVRT